MQISNNCLSTTNIYKYSLKNSIIQQAKKDARLEMKIWKNWMKIAGWNQLAAGVMVKYMNNLVSDHQNTFHEQFVYPSKFLN
jgi:hypothetical protein